MISAGDVTVCGGNKPGPQMMCTNAFAKRDEACETEVYDLDLLSMEECKSDAMITDTDYAAPASEKAKVFKQVIAGYVDADTFGYMKEALSPENTWAGKPLKVDKPEDDPNKDPDFTEDIKAVCKEDADCTAPLTKVAKEAFVLTKDASKVREEFIKKSPEYKDENDELHPVYKAAGTTQEQYDTIVASQNASPVITASTANAGGTSLVSHSILIGAGMGYCGVTLENDLREPGQDNSKLGGFCMNPRLELYPASWFGADMSKFNIGLGGSFFFSQQEPIKFDNGGEVTTPNAMGGGVHIAAGFSPVDFMAIRARVGYLHMVGEFMAGMQGKTKAAIHNFQGELGLEFGYSFHEKFGMGLGLYGGLIVGGTRGEEGDSDLYVESQAADWHALGGYFNAAIIFYIL